MSRMRTLSVAAFLAVVSLGAAQAPAASHLWRFNELFTNADGTIQFVEMRECCGSTQEWHLIGKFMTADGTGDIVFFNHNLSPPTDHKYFLLGTEGYANLPGVPQPDFILPDGFLTTLGDTLSYWTYDQATFLYGQGELPDDGYMSLQGDHTTAVNSPTNFAGETGLLDLRPCLGDLNGDRQVTLGDLSTLLANFGTQSGATAGQGDLDGDGDVDLEDLSSLLAHFGQACS